MKVKNTFASICIGVSILASFQIQSATIFEDSFESGDMSTTNTDGFTWDANNATSIVTAEKVVWNNGPKDVAIPAGRDWTPKDSLHSLRFRYAAGAEWSEQRFNLGTPQKDLWIGYWLRVPINFSYGQSGTGINNKFLVIWMDAYAAKGTGTSVTLSMLRSGTGANLAFAYIANNGSIVTGHEQSVPFITTADQGRWMQIVIHVKAESSPGASDGIIQTFRRWEGENNFTKLHDASNAPLKVAPDTNGFLNGYLMGWANSTYSEDTEWLLDSFTLSDTPLVTATIAPNPPTALLIQ